MGFLAGLFGRRAGAETPSPPRALAARSQAFGDQLELASRNAPEFRSILTDRRQLEAFVAGGEQNLTESRALRQAAVWACVTLVGDTAAQVPLKVFRRDSETNARTPLRNTPTAHVLRDPDPRRYTEFQFRRTLAMHVAGWGNGYAIIHRGGAGAVQTLELVHPGQVDIDELSDGAFRYRVHGARSTGPGVSVSVQGPGQPVRVIEQEDMLHVPGYAFDARVGLSVIRAHAVAIDSSEAQAEYVNTFYREAPRMSGVLETEKALKETEIGDLRERFTQFFRRGGSQEGRAAVLTNGLKFVALTPVNPADADYVNSRKLSTAEIASIFRVPTTFLNQLDAATYDNVNGLSVGFVRYTMTPVFRNLEAEYLRKLVRARDQGSIVIEHIAAGLLRSTIDERFSAYQSALSAGWMTGNEVRALENLAPLEGLDEPRVPLNSEPASGAGDQTEDEPEVVPRFSVLQGVK